MKITLVCARLNDVQVMKDTKNNRKTTKEERNTFVKEHDSQYTERVTIAEAHVLKNNSIF